MGADSARFEGEKYGLRVGKNREQRRIMSLFRARVLEIEKQKEAAFPYGEKYAELTISLHEVVDLGASIGGVTSDAFHEWVHSGEAWA